MTSRILSALSMISVLLSLATADNTWSYGDPADGCETTEKTIAPPLAPGYDVCAVPCETPSDCPQNPPPTFAGTSLDCISGSAGGSCYLNCESNQDCGYDRSYPLFSPHCKKIGSDATNGNNDNTRARLIAFDNFRCC